VIFIVRRRRQRKIQEQDHGYSKMNMLIDESMKSIDLLKTVMNDTIVKYGPTFAIPGHLLFDFQKDLRIVKDLAEGGGGAVKLAQLLTVSQENEQNNQVILKLIKSSEDGTFDSKMDLMAKAVWQQEICIMW